MVRDGKMEKNSFARLSLPKVPGGKTRFLTSEEETAMLKKLGQPDGAWARLATLTGLRLNEQFGLKWADVDLERGIVTLPHTKTGHVQYAHLNEEAKADVAIPIRKPSHTAGSTELLHERLCSDSTGPQAGWSHLAHLAAYLRQSADYERPS